MYEMKKNYRDNAALRESFNQLANSIFCLNFEDWYQNGLWTDKYNPYSVVRDGEVIANVSVNQTDLSFDGKIKHFLQLGTVMTSKDFRRQGLIREIMAAIDADYRGKTDGIYLFANDSVLNFYPKFGFEKTAEYLYSKQITNSGKCQFVKTPIYEKIAWERLRSAIERNVFQGRLDLIHNPELILFYVTKFMQENVYYHADSDTYVIAESNGEEVFLHNIFSGTLHRLDEVTALFGRGIKKIKLGFVPKKEDRCESAELLTEDCTFFIRSETLPIFISEKLRIPSLAHT